MRMPLWPVICSLMIISMILVGGCTSHPPSTPPDTEQERPASLSASVRLVPLEIVQNSQDVTMVLNATINITNEGSVASPPVSGYVQVFCPEDQRCNENLWDSQFVVSAIAPGKTGMTWRNVTIVMTHNQYSLLMRGEKLKAELQIDKYWSLPEPTGTKK